MGAHDGQRRKIAVQALHIGEVPVFEIEHYGFRVGPGYVVPQFGVSAGHVYREMRTEFTGQGPGHARILFEKNYTLRHISPNLQPFVNGGRQTQKPTADVDNRLGLRGGWEPYSTDI